MTRARFPWVSLPRRLRLSAGRPSFRVRALLVLPVKNLADASHNLRLRLGLLTRASLAERIGEGAVPQHFAAVSVNTRAMDDVGVHPEYRFPMWDCVRGRYSWWFSIGVSLAIAIAIAIGEPNFLEFLEGGHEMDEHFSTGPWPENLPALMGLIAVWNINFMNLATLAVLPYDDPLRRFPAYLQSPRWRATAGP